MNFTFKKWNAKFQVVRGTELQQILWQKVMVKHKFNFLKLYKKKSDWHLHFTLVFGIYQSLDLKKKVSICQYQSLPVLSRHCQI
jgi:hypothetical protein